MFAEASFTKKNLNNYLSALGKEYKKRSGKKISAEIILIGGAAILANYGFRDVTYDIDAVIFASSAMKEAINYVGDSLNLPNNWLNADFRKTTSFSDKLHEIAVHYKTFANILEVRTVTAEYLIAMKLLSGRQYKHDISDIAGILWEQQKSGNPISKDAINNAVIYLYGEDAKLPDASVKVLNDAFTHGNYEQAFNEIMKQEKQAKDILLDFEKNNPDGLKGESIDSILEKARQFR